MPDFFTVKQVVKATKVSERCLHHWDVTGVVVPAKKADGAGVYRGYTREDVVCVALVKRMRDAEVSLQRIRKHIPAVRRAVRQSLESGHLPLLLIQGRDVLIITHESEQTHVIDALRDGQLAFAIDMGPVTSEVDRRLTRPEWQRRAHRESAAAT